MKCFGRNRLRQTGWDPSRSARLFRTLKIKEVNTVDLLICLPERRRCRRD